MGLVALSGPGIRTRVAWFGRQILTHCATLEALRVLFEGSGNLLPGGVPKVFPTLCQCESQLQGEAIRCVCRVVGRAGTVELLPLGNESHLV